MVRARSSGVLHLLFRGVLQGRDAKLDHHVHELRQVDAAVRVDVVLGKELLDGLLVHVIVAPELATGAHGSGAALLRLLGAHLEVAVEAPGHLLDELLCGEAVGPAQVARALPVDHGAMHGLAEEVGVVVDKGLVGGIQVRSVAHGPDEGLGHAQGVEARLLPAEVRVPQICHSAVGCLKLLDGRAVVALADEVGGDEARGAVDLRHLIREHVAIVVVRGHAEAAVRPSDDLHGGRIGDEVGELVACAVEEPRLDKVGLVVLVEDVLHDGPKALLPLEDRFLGHHVGGHLHLEAPLEEDVGQVSHVVIGVVIHHRHVQVVVQHALVHGHRVAIAVLGVKLGHETPFTHLLPPRAVLAAHSMPLKEHWLLEAQLHAVNVDGVARDGDSVPAAAHEAIGRSPGLLEAHFRLLHRCGRDRGLFEDGTDARACSHSVLEHPILRVVSGFARQVIVLPGTRVKVWIHPLIHDELHAVTSHLFPLDEHEGRGGHFRTESAPRSCREQA
mmetsp:Transcript_25493/g.69014  ORF Transcript_25493/g.69014 Transcript_25493/m.69014 type:complete len:502 (-) Transcript_25493:32-1537(-)